VPDNDKSRIRHVFAVIPEEVPSAVAHFDFMKHILLSRRADAMDWCLPGGCPQEGEDDITALVRLVREEIGLDVAVIQRLGQDYSGRPGDAFGTAAAYVCKITGGRFRVTSQGNAMLYLSQEEVCEGYYRQHETEVDPEDGTLRETTDFEEIPRALLRSVAGGSRRTRYAGA